MAFRDYFLKIIIILIYLQEEMVNMAAVAIVDAQDKQKRQQMKLEIQ